MRNGERFKIHRGRQSSMICKIRLNASTDALVGDNVFISFANIIALHGGHSGEYSDVNPSASFFIEYKESYEYDAKRVLFEIVHREKYLARRNWWINGIISCVADNAPFRVPPSISSISKMLSAVTSDTESVELRFVDVDDIEDTFSISMSLASSTKSSTHEISIDAEIARKKAEQRVKKYKQLQKQVQRLSIKRESASIDIVPIEKEGSEEVGSHATIKKGTVPIDTAPAESADLINQAPNQEIEMELGKAPAPAKQMKKPPQVIQTDLTNSRKPQTEKPFYETAKRSDPLVRSITTEDAEKWKLVILNLTQKLKDMEELQRIQTEKMQKYVDKDALTIKRYESEIKKLRKENKFLLNNQKHLESKAMDAKITRDEVEKELALKIWEKQKSDEGKNKKLKSVITRLSQEMEGLYDRLERAESGYNAAVQNCKRESKNKQRLEKEFDSLQQRYIVDTQQLKDDLLEITAKNKNLKKHSKKLRAALSSSEKNEARAQELLKNEIERSGEMEGRIKSLSQQINDAKSVHRKQSNEDEATHNERISDTFEAFNAVNKHNQQLLRENKSLKSHLMQKDMELSDCKKEISSLNMQSQKLTQKIKENEQLYQQKLIDFTEFAQEQMSAQQQMLTDKMTPK